MGFPSEAGNLLEGNDITFSEVNGECSCLLSSSETEDSNKHGYQIQRGFALCTALSRNQGKKILLIMHCISIVLRYALCIHFYLHFIQQSA